MKACAILNSKGITVREIFENSLFRTVQFESILKYRESFFAGAFKRLLVYSMNEKGTKARALINLFCSAYQNLIKDKLVCHQRITTESFSLSYKITSNKYNNS